MNRAVATGTLTDLDRLIQVLGDDATLAELADMSESEAELYHELARSEWFRREVAEC